jgi:hypothetical protein
MNKNHFCTIGVLQNQTAFISKIGENPKRVKFYWSSGLFGKKNVSGKGTVEMKPAFKSGTFKHEAAPLATSFIEISA